MPEDKKEYMSAEYRMAYMNNILCYYILKLLDTSKEKNLADEIYETARQMAFGDVLKNIEEKETNGKEI